LFKSDDFGATWTAIMEGLPASPINVVIEDNVDADLLYIGNDRGVYVSFDQGSTWSAFENGLPKVAVHDLVIQTKAADLLVGTHGRSIYKTNIAALQKVNNIKGDAITLFKLKDVRHSKNWGKSWSKWLKPSTPSINTVFFSKNKGTCTFEVLSENGAKIQEFTKEATIGLNYAKYDVTFNEAYGKRSFEKEDVYIEKAKNNCYYLPKGSYVLKVSLNGNESRESFKIN